MMGKEKYQKRIEELFKKSIIVDAASLRRIVGFNKKDSLYHKQIIRNLMMSGKIRQVTKGTYTKHEDPSIAVFSFSPAYLGLQDAMSLHGLWEQETIPIIITPRRARQGIRKIMGMNVMVRRMDRKYFFGYEHHKQGDIYIPYSDIEKTLIDMLYFNEKIGKEYVKDIIGKIDKEKLKEYLKRYPERIEKKARKIGIL